MSKKVFAVTMAFLAVVMTVLIITMMAANKRSDAELAEIDSFIATYETAKQVETTESKNWVRIEATHEEETTTLRTHTVQLDDLVPAEETESEEVPAYTIEELAHYVLDAGLNGSDREKFLGDKYEEVQRYIDDNYNIQYLSESESGQLDLAADGWYAEDVGTGSVLTADSGINYYNGVLETYYNLPMDGLVQLLYDLGYSGTYWVRDDGVKMWNEYVIVAADYDWLPRGSVIETSLGTGMVLDTGEGGWYWTDIATCWE